MWLSRSELQKGLPTPWSFPFAAAVNICSAGSREDGSAVVVKLEMNRLIWYNAVASSEMGCAGRTATG